MTKMIGHTGVAVGAAILCLAAGVYGSSERQTFPLATSAVPTAPGARTGARGTVMALASAERTMVPNEVKSPAGSARSSANGTTVGPTTSGTVMGGGNPATWPAARAFPPSLAGAYSPNLKTAFLALVRYSDWAGVHPNPDLVKNFCFSSADIYA